MEINFLLQSLLSGEPCTGGLRWLSWAGSVVISGILGPRKSLFCVLSPEHSQQVRSSRVPPRPPTGSLLSQARSCFLVHRRPCVPQTSSAAAGESSKKLPHLGSSLSSPQGWLRSLPDEISAPRQLASCGLCVPTRLCGLVFISSLHLVDLFHYAPKLQLTHSSHN